MSAFKTSALALAILASVAAVPAQAAPVASAVSVVTFENFTINWIGAGTQVDAADFASLSVTSSQLTAATMTGQAGIADNVSSSVGADLKSRSALGIVDPVINATPAFTASQSFNVPTLPLVGNFSISASNETGSPISNFFGATPNADLHNASYASLDTLAGFAGTSTSSQLSSTQEFVALVGGDSLRFNFDLGNYIGAFLDAGAAQSASASWSISFTLIDTTLGGVAAFFATGDTISNNDPGTGITEAGALNSALVGGFVTTTAGSFDSAPIVAGNTYLLTANISTRTQVERVAVPEPGVLGLLGLALAALAITRRSPKRA